MPLPAQLAARVLARLGFATPPPRDAGGLAALYRAWCAQVPFDNLRKMIALRTGAAELPGGHADDFLDAWLEHGTGGTCWPSSNALHQVLEAAGFPAVRLAARMRDGGVTNHGTVRVRLDDGDWLVDSSMLTNLPLPLGDGVFASPDPVVAAEVEREGDEHVCWFTMPPSPAPFPCRVLPDPVDHALYLRSYEASRERSPFNQRLYARRNHPDGVRLLFGNTRVEVTAAGADRRELTPEQLCAALRDDIGLGEAIVDRWREAGGLEASFEPPVGPPPPAVDRLPPSRRG